MITTMFGRCPAGADAGRCGCADAVSLDTASADAAIVVPARRILRRLKSAAAFDRCTLSFLSMLIACSISRERLHIVFCAPHDASEPDVTRRCVDRLGMARGGAIA